MHTTLLDTITGQQIEAPDWSSCVFWWTEGNGACDCNRALAMGCEDLEDKEGDVEVCLGYTRSL